MAGFLSEEFLSDVLARNDIVDVVGEYVQLRRKGQKHWGLCPFHGEKTPSFSVAQDKQFYYCFGCHAAGNAFQFIQNMERCDFVDAVEILAHRAGLQMPERQNSGDNREKEEQRTALYEIGRAAARFFHDKLYSPQGLPALQYLERRGLTERLIKRFGLGYAPDGRDEALRFLEAQGFSREHLKAFAVVGEKEGRWYDYFRNRVMFPIIDRRGRIIGFGGRVMDDSQPKYLNSPDTPVFNKRHNLFGLNLASQIRNLERMIIVEGYMDVISMHQAGLNYTVATLGTALTEDQARLMKRFCSEVFIAYDGDSAGQKATMRSLDILRDAGLGVKVLHFPENMDPDDYAKKFGLPGLEDLMDKAPNATDYQLRTIAARWDLAREEGRTGYLTEVCRDVLTKIASPVELDIYIKRLSRETGVSEDAIRDQTGLERSSQKAAGYSAVHSRNTNAVTDTPSRMLEFNHLEARKDNAARDAESFLLRLAMVHPGYLDRLKDHLQVESFAEERRELAGIVLDGQAKQISPAELMNTVSQQSQVELARLLMLELPEEKEQDRLFADCLKRMEARHINERVDVLKEMLKQPQYSDVDRDGLKQELAALLRKQAEIKSNR